MRNIFMGDSELRAAKECVTITLFISLYVEERIFLFFCLINSCIRAPVLAFVLKVFMTHTLFVCLFVCFNLFNVGWIYNSAFTLQDMKR